MMLFVAVTSQVFYGFFLAVSSSLQGTIEFIKLPIPTISVTILRSMTRSLDAIGLVLTGLMRQGQGLMLNS